MTGGGLHRSGSADRAHRATREPTTWARSNGLTGSWLAIELQQDGGVIAHRFEPSAARASPGMNDVAHSGCSAQWTTA
jgi:hypothetical protein